MSRDAEARLLDIIEAIERIRTYEQQIRAGAPVMLGRDAVVFRLVVIGEAVKDLPEELKAHEAEIEWAGIAGMRDILTHQYHRIDQGVADDVVSRRLKQLAGACRQLLARP